MPKTEIGQHEKSGLSAAEYANVKATATAQAHAENILAERMRRNLAQTETFTAAEFTTFAAAGLYETWEPGRTYPAGRRLVHESVVYEVQQDVTALESQSPGSEGMLAVYRPLSLDGSEDADGTREKPYTFLYGMDVVSGAYYLHEGALYIAKADMPACVWTPGTAGLWQWEAVE